MGTDCTVITERCENGYWEPIGVLSLPRNYTLFEDIRKYYTQGYPDDIDYLSKKVLDDNEDWGEGYMSYNEWLKLLKKCEYCHLNVIKKKYYDNCRVIFRFDN